MIKNAAVLELFAGQHGVARDQQIRALGASARWLHRAVANGTLRRIGPGVVALAGQRQTFMARCTAARLLIGDECFLDGPTAGVIHGLRAMPRVPLWVTTPRRVRVKLPSWIRSARTTWVEPGDVTTIEGMNVASPCRMLLTLAAVWPAERLERAAEDAWHLGLASPGAVAAYVDRARRPGRPGIKALDSWAHRVGARRRPSQSALELDVLVAIRAVGLPEPVRQHPLQLTDGQVIHLDLAWPDVRLAVEPGHSWWHGGDRRMNAERTDT